ncbi:MAG: DUF5706 domain-containing protein [Bacteroidales bacterium]
MNKIDVGILDEAENFVSDFLAKNLSDNFRFHTIYHTKYVVENAELIGKECQISEDEMNVLKLSAWFHDTGYAVDPTDHEKESVKIALKFLVTKDIDSSIISQVERCILATKIPQQPKDLLSQIICDADLKHLTEDNYFEEIDKMRVEWTNLLGEKIGKRKFHKNSVKFFNGHEYHTDYGKKVLAPKKEKILNLIKKEIHMLEKQKEKNILESKGKEKKTKGYSRGVESMFRLTARNQISLSSIADNKSNILISVNAIIMSVTMTVLVTRFEETPNIILPTLIFLLFCLVTIVFAILSTRPNISSGTFSKEDIKENKVNLLFFGNFYNMELDDYEWAIGELMRNDENLYGTMIKDQYALGKVLAKKYKLLRVAYNVFMFGIIISVLAFVFAFVNI